MCIADKIIYWYLYLCGVVEGGFAERLDLVPGQEQLPETRQTSKVQVLDALQPVPTEVNGLQELQGGNQLRGEEREAVVGGAEAAQLGVGLEGRRKQIAQLIPREVQLFQGRRAASAEELPLSDQIQNQLHEAGKRVDRTQ